MIICEIISLEYMYIYNIVSGGIMTLHTSLQV